MDDSDDLARYDYSLQETKKLKKQIKTLQAELEDKDAEVYLAENNLKDAEKKLKSEQARRNDDLNEKQERIDDLEIEINMLKKKLKQVPRESSYENNSDSLQNQLQEMQKKFDALLGEMNNKDQQISEMDNELREANISGKEVKHLKQELQDQIKISTGKDEKIKELKRKNDQCSIDIDALQEKIGVQESEIIRLKEEVKNHNRNRENTHSSNDSDTSKNYLLQSLKLKDEKIAKLRQKLEDMKNNQTAGSPRTNEKVCTLLKEISLNAGIKVTNIDEAINIIKDVIQKPQPQMRYGLKHAMSRDGSDQLNGLFQENEDLKDKVAELTKKLDTLTKKHRKELNKKEEELKEIQDEVEELQKKNTIDYKTKSQLASLKEKVQELECQLEKKDEEINIQERKYREIERKYSDKVEYINGVNAQISEFQNQARDMTKKNNKLEKVIEEKDNELQNQFQINNQLEMDLQDKKKAIDTIKMKMTENKKRADQLDMELQQKLGENMDLERTNQKLGTENIFFKTKIENQEKEIGIMRMNTVPQHKPDNGRPNITVPGNRDSFPDWWNHHKY